MINKDKVLALKAKLETEHNQHIANANAAKGAIQVCEHILSLDEAAPDCTEDCGA